MCNFLGENPKKNLRKLWYQVKSGQHADFFEVQNYLPAEIGGKPLKKGQNYCQILSKFANFGEFWQICNNFFAKKIDRYK